MREVDLEKEARHRERRANRKPNTNMDGSPFVEAAKGEDGLTVRCLACWEPHKVFRDRHDWPCSKCGAPMHHDFGEADYLYDKLNTPALGTSA